MNLKTILVVTFIHHQRRCMDHRIIDHQTRNRLTRSHFMAPTTPTFHQNSKRQQILAPEVVLRAWRTICTSSRLAKDNFTLTNIQRHKKPIAHRTTIRRRIIIRELDSRKCPIMRTKYGKGVKMIIKLLNFLILLEFSDVLNRNMVDWNVRYVTKDRYCIRIVRCPTYYGANDNLLRFPVTHCARQDLNI